MLSAVCGQVITLPWHVTVQTRPVKLLWGRHTKLWQLPVSGQDLLCLDSEALHTTEVSFRTRSAGWKVSPEWEFLLSMLQCWP